MMMNDVNKELRRTKRALWMMKALYFYIMMLYAQMLARVAHEKIIHDSNMFPNPTDKCREVYQHEANIFDDARIRCLKNADKLKDSESRFLAFANPCWMPPVKWMDGKPYYDAEKAVKCIYERMDSLEKRISYLTRLALHAMSGWAMGMSLVNHLDERGSRKKQIAYFMVSQKFENLHKIEKNKWRKEKAESYK